MFTPQNHENITMLKLCIFRQKRVKINFSDIITTEHKMSLCQKDLNIKLKNYNVDNFVKAHDSDVEMEENEVEISKYDGNFLFFSVQGVALSLMT